MNTIRSISNLEKVFETTGSRPILILCEDMEYYVCKYNRWPGGEAKKLVNELLAANFAKYWGFDIPEFNIVNINPTHINGHHSLQPLFFNSPCFGSKFNSNLKEVDEFYSSISPYEKRKFLNNYEFLKIALFDIWLANKDRNFNNYNLLMNVENGFQFIPIDHDAIFNTGNLDKGLVLISENESLIDTNLANKFFSRKEVCDPTYLTSIEKEYYICVSECKKNIDNILELIPVEWNVDIKSYKNLLVQNLFNKQWVNSCFQHFLEIIQICIK